MAASQFWEIASPCDLEQLTGSKIIISDQK
jgi:hypothetical protein